MTLILKLDLDMVKMYLHTKNEVSMLRGSKVIACTNRNTDRQTDRQTDMTENITYPHTRLLKMCTQAILEPNDNRIRNHEINCGCEWTIRPYLNFFFFKKKLA